MEKPIISILGMLPNKLDNNTVMTPPKVAQEMIDLLPNEVWNSKTTFFDPACKSGIFLRLIYDKLMETPYTEPEFQDKQAKSKHILHKQLFGVALDPMCKQMSTRTAYGFLDPDSNIKFIEKYTDIMKNEDNRYFIEAMKKEFGTMKFDVIIGNPPYNNDMYIDFLLKLKNLYNSYMCMITPAKWQAKGGKKNEQFRQEIVPYMSDIIFYPDCSDVFNIGEVSGISYYLLYKHNIDKAYIKNICKLQNIYNDEEIRCITNRETLFNKGNKINEKLTSYKKFDLGKTQKNKRYQVWTNNKVAIGGGKSQGTLIFSGEGMLQCLQISRLIDSENNAEVASIIADSQQTFSSESKDECRSFISWIYTKFVRFLLSINLAGLTGIVNSSNDWWRFIPAPEAFDHIFTDQELYAKYNLTDEEINIIESVIKERK